MVGGQAVDMASDDVGTDLDGLRHIHALKTGALIRASVEAGARLGGASQEEVDALLAYGDALGLGFQIVDDILDVSASTETLGKPQGSDARNGKGTYVALMGLEGARREATRVLDQARSSLASLGAKAAPLSALADYVEHRSH